MEELKFLLAEEEGEVQGAAVNIDENYQEESKKKTCNCSGYSPQEMIGEEISI